MIKIKSFLLLLILLISVPAFAQSQIVSTEKIDVATDQPKNILGTAYAENMIKIIEKQINANNYAVAKQNTDSIYEWVSDAAEYHTELFKTLKKLENADKQANIERELAIKFAVMRDKLLFLQAKIFIFDNNLKKAVENLVEVVKSQPETELGFKAYKMLQEIGFTYSVGTESIKTEPIQP